MAELHAVEDQHVGPPRDQDDERQHLILDLEGRAVLGEHPVDLAAELRPGHVALPRVEQHVDGGAAIELVRQRVEHGVDRLHVPVGPANRAALGRFERPVTKFDRGHLVGEHQLELVEQAGAVDRGKRALLRVGPDAAGEETPEEQAGQILAAKLPTAEVFQHPGSGCQALGSGFDVLGVLLEIDHDVVEALAGGVPDSPVRGDRHGSLLAQLLADGPHESDPRSLAGDRVRDGREDFVEVLELLLDGVALRVVGHARQSLDTAWQRRPGFTGLERVVYRTDRVPDVRAARGRHRTLFPGSRNFRPEAILGSMVDEPPQVGHEIRIRDPEELGDGIHHPLPGRLALLERLPQDDLESGIGCGMCDELVEGRDRVGHVVGDHLGGFLTGALQPGQQLLGRLGLRVGDGFERGGVEKLVREDVEQSAAVRGRDVESDQTSGMDV